MTPSQPQLLRVETVADLPVLWALLLRLDLPASLDRLYPAPVHWKGPLTPGEVLALWLLFVLSQADHCLNHVEPWVAQHQGVLSALLGKPVLPAHAHDDRLADWLTRLGTGDAFAALEHALNRQTLRVYQLPADLVRIDATTANSYAGVLSEQGILQFGHSKDDPDRPQFKVAAAALDPLGLPLVTAVVPGNTADDPLYAPLIQALRQSLGQGGRTYVGDCKMAALATRALVAAGGDCYLCPLSEAQLSRADRDALLQPLWQGTQALEAVTRPGPRGQAEEGVAEGFAVEVPLVAVVDGREVSWTERRWLVRSRAYAHAQEAALGRRLHNAEAALRELTVRKRGKKRRYYADLQEAAAAIVAGERVEGLLHYTVQVHTASQYVRAYGGRPAHWQNQVSFTIAVQRDEVAIAQRQRELGWQVYATNARDWTLAAVVWGYRGQYRIEDDWSRLKGRTLGLTPLYLQDEVRIAGLVYLLSVALRVLSLVEWEVRERLQREGKPLRGVYAGQPGRQTMRPSAELLLRVLKTIQISVIDVAGQVHVLLTPLTEVQQQLLACWGLPPDLYERVASGFPKPP